MSSADQLTIPGMPPPAEALDYWPTPEWCTRLLLPLLPPFAVIVEPCAGNGAIARVLVEHHYTVYASDPVRQPERAPGCTWIARPVDATMAADLARFVDACSHDRRAIILTNPPFSLSFEVTQACVDTGAPTWLLLRLGFLASWKRRAWLMAHPPAVRVLSRRPSFSGDAKTDSQEYAWMGWGVDGAGTIGWL